MFRIGDRIKRNDGTLFSNKEVYGTVKRVSKVNGRDCDIWIEETGNYVSALSVCKVEEEYDYQLESKLSLQQLIQLHMLIGTCDNLSDLYDELSKALDEEKVDVYDYTLKDFKDTEQFNFEDIV